MAPPNREQYPELFEDQVVVEIPDFEITHEYRQDVEGREGLTETDYEPIHGSWQFSHRDADYDITYGEYHDTVPHRTSENSGTIYSAPVDDYDNRGTWINGEDRLSELVHFNLGASCLHPLANVAPPRNYDNLREAQRYNRIHGSRPHSQDFVVPIPEPVGEYREGAADALIAALENDDADSEIFNFANRVNPQNNVAQDILAFGNGLRDFVSFNATIELDDPRAVLFQAMLLRFPDTRIFRDDEDIEAYCKYCREHAQHVRAWNRWIDKIPDTDEPDIVANSGPMETGASSKGAMPIIPVIASERGNTGGGVPMHGDMPASSTASGPINLPATPQIRASRDMPAQTPLMQMQGGPPDMSMMNMYQDDILNLVYRQFHAGSTTIQQNQPMGTIVFRMPYGINLLSVYAQNWARLHKRYNGRIRVTMSTSGVPMMKGNILVGIVRNMPANTVTTYSVAALQKINWVLINLDGSGEYCIEVGDARKTNFFRDVAEDPVNADPTDLVDRPGIIGVVYTPLTNQFGQGADASVVINFRTAAISPLEDPQWGFKCWEPIDATVVTRSLQDDQPNLVYVSDIMPTIANRSLYLDGAKVQDVDPSDLTQLDWHRSEGVGTITFNTTPAGVRCRPYHSTNGTLKSMFVCLVEMNPDDYEWATVAKGYGNQPNEDVPYLPQVVSGEIIEPKPGNEFVGTSTATEKLKITNLRVINYQNDLVTNKLEIQQVTIVSYKRGRLIFLKINIVDDPNWGNNEMDRLEDIPGVIPISQTIWPIGIDTPTTSDSLPNGYYNVVAARDGQVQFLAQIGALPVLFPDVSFTRSILRIRNALVGMNSSVTVDLIDRRNGDTVGYLFTLGDQVVIRTDVPASNSYHYRVNIDLQFMALANVRETTSQPVSDAKAYLTQIDAQRGMSKYDLLSVLKKMDRSTLDDLFLSPDKIIPNAAMAAGMAAAGAVAGGAQGLISWLTAKQMQNYKLQTQDNYFLDKFKTQWALNQQIYQQKMQMSGAMNYVNQPGAAVANNAIQSSAQAPPQMFNSQRAQPMPSGTQHPYVSVGQQASHEVTPIVEEPDDDQGGFGAQSDLTPKPGGWGQATDPAEAENSWGARMDNPSEEY